MATWALNGSSLESLGLRFAGGEFRTQSVSTMRLDRTCDFDAAEELEFGDAAVLTRDGARFFVGKIDSVPKYGSGGEEGHGYDVVDAWADLEATIYQELWFIGTGSALLPKSVLGIGYNADDEEWQYLTVGAQITAVIEYAISEGVDLQVGTIPVGELLVPPSEVSNVSCAEMILMCLKLHPDWRPWIDHTTTPPTFHVSPVNTAGAVAAMDAVTLPVDGSGDVAGFSCIRRDDQIPDAVRIVYEFATVIDSEVYRNVVIDKYPTDGPDGGPRVIQATIPLAGMQAQIQKQEVETRAIPTTHAEAKIYLKEKFPSAADIPDANFSVRMVYVGPVPDAEADPPIPPINPNAPRLVGETLEDTPRELVRGAIHEWMRRKVGKVEILWKISATPTATAAERKILKAIPRDFTIVSTNAVNKTYKGLSQWIAAEDVPTGVAQATYEAILDGVVYQGSATLTAEEIGATRYHGKKVHLSEGAADWATMGAPIHSVDFDVAAGTVTLGYGPVPFLAPADFLELQRILRFRPAVWWSLPERASNELGGEDVASAKGDTAGAFDVPETTVLEMARTPVAFEVHNIRLDDTTWKCLVQPGGVTAIDPALGATPMSEVLPTVEGTVSPMSITELTVSADHVLYCKVLTDPLDLVTGRQIVSLDSTPTTVHAQPPTYDLDGVEDVAGVNGEYFYKIADFEMVGDELEVATQYQQGGPIIHRPGRNGHNGSLTINDCAGDPVARIDILQGQYVSPADNPATAETDEGHQEVEAGCDGAGTSTS